jgi:hypothetical protein
MRLFNTEMLGLQRFPAESRPSTYRRVGRYGAARFKRAGQTPLQLELLSLPPLSSIWRTGLPTRFEHAA